MKRLRRGRGSSLGDSERDFDNDDFRTTTRVELEIRNNVDWKQPFQLNDFNTGTNQRTPHDLTGASMVMDLFLEPMDVGFPPLASGSIVAMSLSTSAGTIVIDPTAPSTGAFSIDVPAVQMWTLIAGNYVGDCLVFGSDGSIVSAMTLQLRVNAGDTPPIVPLSAISLVVAPPPVSSP